MLLTSCAASLHKSSDFVEVPQELEQSLEDLTASQPAAPEPDKAATSPVAEPLPESPEAPKKPSSPSKKTRTSKPHPEKSEKSEKVAESSPPAKTPTWIPSHWPYTVGERVTWVLRYGPIEGGIAIISVEPPKVLEGEPVIHYRGKVKSSKLLELFYKIDNQIDTYVRMKDHLPLRQVTEQNESARWGRRVVIFDPEKNEAKFFQNITKKDGGRDDVLRTDTVTPFAQDIFGGIFFFRFLDGVDHVNFPIHDRWKNWNNELTYLGDETIHIPAGTFETHHFKMLPRVEGALEPKGDVEIWAWKDPSHHLLKFTAKIKVGSIVGEVRSIETGQALTQKLPEFKTPR